MSVFSGEHENPERALSPHQHLAHVNANFMSSNVSLWSCDTANSAMARDLFVQGIGSGTTTSPVRVASPLNMQGFSTSSKSFSSDNGKAKSSKEFFVTGIDQMNGNTLPAPRPSKASRTNSVMTVNSQASNVSLISKAILNSLDQFDTSPETGAVGGLDIPPLSSLRSGGIGSGFFDLMSSVDSTASQQQSGQQNRTMNVASSLEVAGQKNNNPQNDLAIEEPILWHHWDEAGDNNMDTQQISPEQTKASNKRDKYSNRSAIYSGRSNVNTRKKRLVSKVSETEEEYLYDPSSPDSFTNRNFAVVDSYKSEPLPVPRLSQSRQKSGSFTSLFRRSNSMGNKSKKKSNESKSNEKSTSAASIGKNFIQGLGNFSKVKLSLKSKTKPKYWTAEEDQLLKHAIEVHGEKHWKRVAEYVPDRTHSQCLQRWKKVLKPGLKKGHWSTEEDENLILSAYAQIDRSQLTENKNILNFKINWGIVAKGVEGRTAKQCRERWINHLSPEVNKNDWTAEEDQLLLQLYKKTPRKWAHIAKGLYGRTENMVKVRYHTLSREAQEQGKGEPSLGVYPLPEGQATTNATARQRAAKAVHMRAKVQEKMVDHLNEASRKKQQQIPSPTVSPQAMNDFVNAFSTGTDLPSHVNKGKRNSLLSVGSSNSQFNNAFLPFNSTSPTHSNFNPASQQQFNSVNKNNNSSSTWDAMRRPQNEHLNVEEMFQYYEQLNIIQVDDTL